MKNSQEKIGRVLSREEQSQILGGAPGVGCQLASVAAYANCMATKPDWMTQADCQIHAQFVYDNCIQR